MAGTKSSVLRPKYRRRRIIWSILLLSFGFFCYLGTRADSSFGLWSLPAYLRSIGLSSSSSRAQLVSDAKALDLLQAGRPRVQEIDGLLHFVTAYPDRRLDEDDGKINVEGLGTVQVDGSEPVDIRVYSPNGDDNWQEHVEYLRKKHPLVFFSKSYCPFCKRTKALLQSYELSPSPTIVELDLRADGPIIQAILKRLTGRGTVPNILLQGDSIGGSDDLQHMDQEGKLRALLREGGLVVNSA